MDCSACGRTNRDGARFCDECGRPVPDARGARTDGGPVRKTVTVLFCDLVGSTAFGERVDAESNRDVLRRYHAMVQQVIDDHGGTVAKFVGDGVMAIFGVPEVAVDDADRAVGAGLDLQRGFAAIGEWAQQRFDTYLGLRVGINTGEVVIADGDADVVGDVLNTAARLEAACVPGEVLVGEETWRLTRGSIVYESLGRIDAKGKGTGVATFRAVDDAARPDESATPMIGRALELRRLRDVFDSAVETSRAHLVSVIGAPGVGKTRLASEFEQSLGTDAAVVVLRLERAGGATFAPVADLLRAIAGVETLADTDGPDLGGMIVDRLRSVVARLDDAERVSELLAGFLGVGRDCSTEELFFAVRRLLEALGRERPVVVVVDDIQWAEPLFLDLLEYLSEWIGNTPAMVLALARPEIRDIRPKWAEGGRRESQVINLVGLDADATADLAARLIGADALPQDLVARLPDSTEGNPLFVGELMRMLVDDRVIVETDHGWQLRIDADAIDVPPTIQSMLSTRIERLPDDERRLVELASVVGSEFPLGVVASIGSTEPGRLLPVLERLRRRELVEPTGNYWADEPVFRFHHVLVRDSAYRRLLKTSRAELHLRVASWMEMVASRAGGEQDLVVGYHLEQAHELRTQLHETGDETSAIGRRAAALLGAAAGSALERDDAAAAGTLFVRAIGCLEESDDNLPELLMRGCDSLLAVGDLAEARQLLNRLEERATHDERLGAWATTFRAQLSVLTDPDGLEAAARDAADAAQRLVALEDPAGEASARLVRAGALARLGRIGDCEAELDHALAAARRADDDRRVAMVLSAAPVAAVWGPSSLTRAGGRCLDVIRLVRITIGSPTVEATATRCQAVVEALRGHFDVARTMLGEARTTVEELGHRRGVLETQLYSGIVELFAGDPVAAEPFLRAAHAGSSRLGIGADAGRAAAHLSRALLLQGRLDEAAGFAADSDALAGQNLQTAIAAKSARAEVRAAQGAFGEALLLADEAVARAAGTDLVVDRANAHLALARVRRAAGDDPGSQVAVEAAERLFADKGASLDVASGRPAVRPPSN